MSISQNLKDASIGRIAAKRLRSWIKQNCEYKSGRMGDLQYCLEIYYENTRRKRPVKKATPCLVKEYNDPLSPIFRGNKLDISRVKRVKKSKHISEYKKYLNSSKWKLFKEGIIRRRGAKCEGCGIITNNLDLHHKTYARIFNERETDVELLCRKCHKEVHEINK